MKPRLNRPFPRNLFFCGATLLACTSAQAYLVNFNEQNAGNEWTFPTGANLLANATVSPAAPAQHEGSSSSWSILTDGQVGAASDNSKSVTPNNGDSVTFALDLTGLTPGTGHTVTSFDSYCAWGDSGRDNQNYTITYSTVADPTTFLPLATVSNLSGNPINSTHTSLTDTTGVLATNVHSIRLTFAGQENTYTGFREFILRSEPVIHTLTETSTANVWTLPSGSNLLSGSTAHSPVAPVDFNRGNGDVTSFTWNTLTDGSVGAAVAKNESVAPSNNTSVIFPLDTSVNVNGYNISSLDSYSAWPNGGRDDQQFAVRYSTVANPTVFLPLANVDIRTPLVGADLATHARVTAGSGFLATGVAALQFYFNNQENGYVGYREFVALGSAVSLSEPLTWKGSSGSGGNATWNNAPDNNWKKTSDGTAANFNPLAPVTFDATGINRNITTGSGVTSASVNVANNGSTAYSFGGSLLTITNELASSGSGNVTFANPVAASGVIQSGSGSMVFNNELTSSSLTLSGTGGIVFNVPNPTLTGNLSISNGTLTVANNNAVEFAGLSMSGGTALFTTAQPLVASLAGSAGSVVLGKTAGPVNTHLTIGNSSPVTTTFAGSIANAPGAVGRITKAGASTLVLGGTNSYTGPTRVQEGLLLFNKKVSLYGGTTASWTATNLVVEAGASFALKAGGTGEFSEADLGLISLGGFAPDAILSLDTTTDFTLSRNLTQNGLALAKSGSAILTLTGNNTSAGTYRLNSGTLNLASPGTAIPGNLIAGDNTADVFLNMGADNQFGPESVITLAPGSLFQSKMNLRGTTQTVAGLDCFSQAIGLIQNDEIGQPGYTAPPGPASITINAESDHSFRGIIRDQNGGTVTLTKNGPAVQELVNHPAQSYGYTGPTTVNAGTLRLNFAEASSGFGSNISIASGALLEFSASAGNWTFNRVISGPGPVLVTGSNAVILTNGNSSWSGGTTVDGGFLALSTTVNPGAGDGPGQTCVGGAMIPSNLIDVKNSGTLSLDNTAALGQSTMVPEFAPSIRINPGSKLFGGTNSVVFVPNLTLDGALVQVSGGAATGGFNTNICFVGTVVVGGSSSNASTIIPPVTPGPNANASLGSVALPGTTFQVADVTGDSAEDLTVSSNLRDVKEVASPLTKTGPGTMSLVGPKTYTGATHVVAGELRLDTAYLADNSAVSISSGAFLNLLFSGTDTVNTLTLDGVQVAAGVYGSTLNNTPGVIKTARITGAGTVTVSNGMSNDPYAAYASVITNPADRDKTDDPDGDGFTNLQEYLLGGSPIAATGSLTRIERTGSGLIIRWDQRNSGGTYTLQESASLAEPWNASPAIISNAADQSNLYSVDYTRKEATIPVDSTRKFARVRAVTAP